MSKVKIYGNPNPVIGIKEYYSIHDFFGSSAPSKFIDPIENIPDENIKWSVWILLGKEWVKMTKNNKTGATVDYTFYQQSLTRKGIRMLVDANGEKAVLDIKTKENAESKILHVEILDSLGKKPTKLFSYGETITARVHCLNMEKFRINVTLWENDGGKKDLSDISIETKETNVLNGIADVKFTFDTSKVWLANAKTAPGESNEGAFHEYYVTAEFYKKVSKPTQDINVINPDYKVDILSKTSASKPSETENQKTSPAEQKGASKKEIRGIAKAGRKAHDYQEQKIDVKPTANYDPQQEFINSLLMVDVGDSAWHQKNNCGEKYCIKKGSPNSELIREINIRLAGFGGNVPTDEFTDRTEKMIKQFQRDFMKVPETGKVCGNVLLAIDDFSKKFDITTRFWNQMKCDCSKKGQITTSKLRGIRETNSCGGFGDHTGKLTYKATPHNEANHNYEYPGIHRSLLFGFKALQFYFSRQTVYTMDQVTSGYRCRFKNYKTTNHQGKAIDIQFSKNGAEIRGPVRANLQKLRDIRDEFYIKYLGAQEEWPNKNLFSVEPIDLLYYPDGALRYDHTFSWLHIDVRQFESIYLEDNYFCKSLIDLNGKSIIQLAREAGFENTCKCFNTYANNTAKNSSKKSFSCEDKFKKVASIILKHEGGYVNHPSDKGGATNKGITLSTWKKYAMSDTNNEPTIENLKQLTDEDATEIYRRRYWEPRGFCNINDERVSLMVYDWTITSGGAIKQVQKLLVKEFGQKITIDGGIGNQTVTAINSVEDQDKLLKKLSEIRKKYYTDLTYTDGEKNDQDVFLKGWLDRVDDCLKFNP